MFWHLVSKSMETEAEDSLDQDMHRYWNKWNQQEGLELNHAKDRKFAGPQANWVLTRASLSSAISDTVCKNLKTFRWGETFFKTSSLWMHVQVSYSSWKPRKLYMAILKGHSSKITHRALATFWAKRIKVACRAFWVPKQLERLSLNTCRNN